MDGGDSLRELAAAWGSSPPAAELRRYLALAPDRRASALARIRVVARLNANRPDRAGREAAAAELGLSVKRLQALVRAWKDAPGMDAVSSGSLPSRRRPRESRALSLATRIARKAVERDRWVGEPTVTSRIARVLARVGELAPARMTVRRILKDERARSPITLDDVFDEARPRSGPVGPAQAPGGELLLTETTFAAVVNGRHGGRQARAAFIVDLTNGFVVAWAPTGRLDDCTTGGDSVQAIGPWTLPTALHLALDLEPGRRRTVDRAAAAFGASVTVQLRRRTRRYLADVLDVPESGLAIAEPVSIQPPAAGWPRLSGKEFAMILDDIVDRSRQAAERRRADRADAPPAEPADIDDVVARIVGRKRRV